MPIVEEIEKLMLDSNHFDKSQFKYGHVKILPHETWWDKNSAIIRGSVGFWKLPHLLIEKGYFISNIYPDGRERIIWVVTTKKEPKK